MALVGGPVFVAARCRRHRGWCGYEDRPSHSAPVPGRCAWAGLVAGAAPGGAVALAGLGACCSVAGRPRPRAGRLRHPASATSSRTLLGGGDAGQRFIVMELRLPQTAGRGGRRRRARAGRRAHPDLRPQPAGQPRHPRRHRGRRARRGRRDRALRRAAGTAAAWSAARSRSSASRWRRSSARSSPRPCSTCCPGGAGSTCQRLVLVGIGARRHAHRADVVPAGQRPHPGRRERPGLAQRLADRARLGARPPAAARPSLRAGAARPRPGPLPQRDAAGRRHRPRRSASGCSSPSCGVAGRRGRPGLGRGRRRRAAGVRRVRRPAGGAAAHRRLPATAARLDGLRRRARRRRRPDHPRRAALRAARGHRHGRDRRAVPDLAAGPHQPEGDPHEPSQPAGRRERHRRVRRRPGRPRPHPRRSPTARSPRSSAPTAAASRPCCAPWPGCSSPATGGSCSTARPIDAVPTREVAAPAGAAPPEPDRARRAAGPRPRRPRPAPAPALVPAVVARATRQVVDGGAAR